jgi:hypothetical protein
LLNEKQEKTPKLKPIEFVKAARSTSTGYGFIPTGYSPQDFKFVILLKRNYGFGGLDLMWAVSSTEEYSSCYLGHWNDGVTE